MKIGDYDFGKDQKNIEYLIREIKHMLKNAKVFCHDGEDRPKDVLFRLRRQLAATEKFVACSRFGDDYIIADQYRSERFEQLTDDLALLVKNMLDNVVRIVKSNKAQNNQNATGEPKKIGQEPVPEEQADTDRSKHRQGPDTEE